MNLDNSLPARTNATQWWAAVLISTAPDLASIRKAYDDLEAWASGTDTEKRKLHYFRTLAHKAVRAFEAAEGDAEVFFAAMYDAKDPKTGKLLFPSLTQNQATQF